MLIYQPALILNQMEKNPKIEVLRTQLQQYHVEHLQTHLDLISTFLEIGRFEYRNGEKVAGAKSFSDARETLSEARAIINLIDSEEDRGLLGALLDQGELDLIQFEVEIGLSTQCRSDILAP